MHWERKKRGKALPPPLPVHCYSTTAMNVASLLSNYLAKWRLVSAHPKFGRCIIGQLQHFLSPFPTSKKPDTRHDPKEKPLSQSYKEYDVHNWPNKHLPAFEFLLAQTELLAFLSIGSLAGLDDFRLECMVHNPFKAPRSLTSLGWWETRFLDINGEHGELRRCQLA